MFSTFSPSKFRGSLQAKLYREGFFIPPAEAKVLVLTMGVFSLVANYAMQSHWFFLVHGAFWTLNAVRNFLLSIKVR